ACGFRSLCRRPAKRFQSSDPIPAPRIFAAKIRPEKDWPANTDRPRIQNLLPLGEGRVRVLEFVCRHPHPNPLPKGEREYFEIASTENLQFDFEDKAAGFRRQFASRFFPPAAPATNRCAAPNRRPSPWETNACTNSLTAARTRESFFRPARSRRQS